MSKKARTPDPFGAVDGQRLTVDKATTTGTKWETPTGGGSGNANCVRANVSNGETVTVPTECDVIVKDRYVVHGTGLLILQGDAQLVVLT